MNAPVDVSFFARAAKPLTSYRKYWAHRFGPAPFLPMSRKEMDALGWDSCDVILVTGRLLDAELSTEAKREAERIVKEARERQAQLVSEQEVTKQAERAAEDIIEDARAREREIRLGAEDYADEILNTLEVNLSKFIAAVQRGRERLQGRDEPAEVG